MATKRQIEEQDLASETRRNAACADIIEHVRASGHDPETANGVAVHVLSSLAAALEADAADTMDLRRKGWQSAAKNVIAAAEIVKAWRDLVADHKPPAGPPAREPLAEIAVSHRADTPAELDARLEAAFAIPPTVRHIRTALEPVTLGEENSGQAYGALCGGTDGSWTHRGGANCPTCIATYDAERGPYAGPVAFSDDGNSFAMNTTGAGGQVVTTGMGFMPVNLTTFDAAPPLVAEGDAVSIALPDGGVVAGTAQNVVTSGMSTTADLVDVLNIVEPTGPVVRPRMSAAQVREHGLARRRGAEHRSVSQVESFGDCGTRAALSDLERPAWWNVGGKALHACVEEINRWVADGGTLAHPISAEERWLKHFDQQIADQCAATPDHPVSTWRAAKKGSEHYDFWRVEGPIMVQRWVAWLTRMLADGWTIATSTGVPVIEFRTHLDVGIAVPNLSIIDLALLHQQRNTLLVVDAKAGGSAPKDTFQLGVYGWSLLAAGIAGFTPTPDLSNVRGAYWRARTGETHVANLPILSMHPWPDVVQRYRDMDVMERQGVYIPNVTTFCGGCGVRDLCPAQASS